MTRTLLVNGEGVSAESHPLFNVYQIVLQAQLAAISIVLQAQLAAISAIRPGVRGISAIRPARALPAG